MDDINKNNSCSRQRAHLTKEQRLPQYLKETEKVLRTVKSCKSNFKTVLANSRLRGCIFKKVYSLTVNVLKYYNYIQKIIDEINLLEKEKFLRRELAAVLIYEIIFGRNNLPGENKIITIIQAYENDIMKVHQELQSSIDSFMIKETNIPRYVRVHTIVTTVPYVIKDLECLGFKQINYDCPSEEKYLELIKNLEQGCFVIDFHFKDMLVFSCKENLTFLDLYKNGHIFLQDKASYIPVHALNPEPGCAVLDACAAPGMKTIHIASSMKNKGILIACERDKDRFEILKEMVQCGGVKICKALCKDFKQLDPNDQAYSAIEYILLDPSCSGSGMVNRMDEVTDTEDSKNKERLTKLAGFQIILLKHALKFPSVKRVVYSTCSVNEEENEYVVHEALNSCYGAFKLVPVMPEWTFRGSENFEFGNLCLRTVPDKHLTNGFFVAMFERVDCDKYGRRMYISKSKESPNMLQNEGESYSDIKVCKKEKMKEENLFDFQKKPESYESPMCNENSNQFMEEKHEAMQIISCESKKSKKQKKGAENLIDSEMNKELNVNNHDDNIFYEEKELESCELSSYQRKTIDSNSKEFKKNSNVNTSDTLNQTPEAWEDYDSKKPKKLKKKKKEKIIDSYPEANEELPGKLTNMGSKIQICSIIENISPEVSGIADGTSHIPKAKEKHKGKKHLSLEIVSESAQITDADPDMPVYKKKKREKHHSKDSDFQSNEFDNSINSEMLVYKEKKRKKYLSKDSGSQSGELNNSSNTDVPEHKEKKRKKGYSKDCDFQSDELNSNNTDVLHKEKKRKKDQSKDSDFQSDELNNSSNADVPVHKEKKRKREHSKDSDFQSNELDNSSYSEFPVHKEKKRKKEHSKDSDFQSNELDNSSYSELREHKEKKRGKGHSKDSDFQSNELNNSLMIDDNLSLLNNDCLHLSDSIISSSSKTPKGEKTKKNKHKHPGTPDKNVQLSPAADLYKVINETSPSSKETSMSASFEDNYLISKKNKKHAVEKIDEIVCPNNAEMFVPLESDCKVGNRSKKLKSKKHKTEKAADLEELDKTVPNNFERALVCTSSASDHVPSKKGKKCKSKKHDVELSEDFKSTDETVAYNQEDINASTENDCAIKKKSKKCKSKKHEIEKIGDLEGTDKTDVFSPEETGNSIKNDSAEKKNKEHEVISKQMDDFEIADEASLKGIFMSTNSVQSCVSHKKSKKHKTKIGNVDFSESLDENKTVMENSESTSKSDSVKLKKSKKFKRHLQKEGGISSVNEKEDEIVLTHNENMSTHLSLNNSVKEIGRGGESTKHDFSFSLPDSEEELEALLFR